MASIPTFTDHRFARRRGVDSKKIIPTGWDGDDRVGRSMASRFWGSHVVVSRAMAQKAREIQEYAHADADARAEMANHRAYSLALYGTDNDADDFAVHAAGLLKNFGLPPSDHERSLWLVCRDVHFHDDVNMAAETAFVVWHVAGPAKAIDFPNLGFGVTTQVGDALLFDGLQPHGVRKPEFAGKAFTQKDKEKSPSNHVPEDTTVYFSMDFRMTQTLDKKMDVSRGKCGDCSNFDLSVNPATGASVLTLY